MDPYITIGVLALVSLTACLFYRFGLNQGELRGMILMVKEKKAFEEFAKKFEEV